jgi:uncharacterized membrane protein
VTADEPVQKRQLRRASWHCQSARPSVVRYALVVFAAFAVASSGSAWGQDTGDEDRPFPANTFHAFLLDNGEFTTIDPPGASGALTAATRINDREQIVGYYLDAGGIFHGFLQDKRGVFTEIDHPDAPLGTVALDLNNRGQIVGAYSEVSNTRPINTPRAFLLDDSSFTLIDALGADCTVSGDINDRGEFVGAYLDAGGPALGFLRDERGVFTTIDVPGAEQTGAVGINNRGQIVDAYVDAGGTDPVFLCGAEASSPRSTSEAPNTTATPGWGMGKALLP